MPDIDASAMKKATTRIHVHARTDERLGDGNKSGVAEEETCGGKLLSNTVFWRCCDRGGGGDDTEMWWLFLYGVEVWWLSSYDVEVWWSSSNDAGLSPYDTEVMVFAIGVTGVTDSDESIVDECGIDNCSHSSESASWGCLFVSTLVVVQDCGVEEVDSCGPLVSGAVMVTFW